MGSSGGQRSSGGNRKRQSLGVVCPSVASSIDGKTQQHIYKHADVNIRIGYCTQHTKTTLICMGSSAGCKVAYSKMC